jgi:hypothetical protein
VIEATCRPRVRLAITRVLGDLLAPPAGQRCPLRAIWAGASALSLVVTDRRPGWPRQLRFERLSVVGDPPESGRYKVNDTLSNEMLQVQVRGERIYISDRLNPVLQWAVPVFVGRIERTGKQPTIEGLLRPSWFGLAVAAAPIVIPLLWILAGEYVTGAIMFGSWHSSCGPSSSCTEASPSVPVPTSPTSSRVCSHSPSARPICRSVCLRSRAGAGNLIGWFAIPSRSQFVYRSWRSAAAGAVHRPRVTPRPARYHPRPPSLTRRPRTPSSQRPLTSPRTRCRGLSMSPLLSTPAPRSSHSS